jgi:hypothetical protein
MDPDMDDEDVVGLTRDMAAAWMMLSHKRLGRTSNFWDMDDNVIRDIGVSLVYNKEMCDHMCDGYLGLLFNHCTDRKVRMDVGEMLMPSIGENTVTGCLVTQGERGLIYHPEKNLAKLVWEQRKAFQQYIEKLHRMDHEFSIGDQHREVFIELGLACKLRISENPYVDDDDSDYDDSDFYDGDDDWKYPSHLFVSDCTVQDLMHKLGDDMRIITELSDDKATRQKLLAPIVAEALILQACVFPICSETTKTCLGSFEPCFDTYDGDPNSSTVFVQFCHEYERDLAESGCRMGSSIFVGINVHKEGRLVKLTYHWLENLFERKCKCHWCTTFQERHPEVHIIDEALEQSK